MARKNLRRGLLASIHVMQKELALDTEMYRDMLFSLTGARTCKTLDDRQLSAVAAHMAKQLGKPVHRGFKGRPANMDRIEAPREFKKVEALLADSKLSWNYANGIAKRMFKIDHVSWCDADQLRAIIAALTKRAAKLGKVYR